MAFCFVLLHLVKIPLACSGANNHLGYKLMVMALNVSIRKRTRALFSVSTSMTKTGSIFNNSPQTFCAQEGSKQNFKRDVYRAKGNITRYE